MPHTHPKYRLTIALDGQAPRTSSMRGASSLNDAVATASCFNEMIHDYGWDGQHYGTEPRYWITCCEDLGGPPVASSWHPSTEPLPWAEAAAAWQCALERSGNPSHQRGVVAA